RDALDVNDRIQSWTPAPSQPGPGQPHWALAMARGRGAFLLSLLGIFTRPASDLAASWPANAFMLAVTVRCPRTAGPVGWMSCALGYFMADLVTGNPLWRNLVLNSGNVLAVAGGYAVLHASSVDDRRLRNPNSIL